MQGPVKWDYVRIMSERYQGACRKEKRLILDELEKNLKVHRKSAIRVLNSIKTKKPQESRGRRRIYNDFVVQHLKKLWLEMGQLCSRRMKKAMPRWIVHYDAPEVTKHLLGLYDAEVVFLKPRPAFMISSAPVPASNIYR